MKKSNGWIDNSYSLGKSFKIVYLAIRILPINQLEVHTRRSSS